MVNQARYLAADAGDDLLTLLWEQEFQFIQYQFVEFFGEGGGALPEADRRGHGGRQRRGDASRPAQPRRWRRRRREPKGVVDLEDFDSTLYFLDEAEINAVARPT